MTATSNPAHHPLVSRTLLALCLVSAIAGFDASAANAAVARTPQSIECSKAADAKGLHGKERETFRAECKRGSKTSEALPTPKPAQAAATH